MPGANDPALTAAVNRLTESIDALSAQIGALVQQQVALIARVATMETAVEEIPQPDLAPLASKLSDVELVLLQVRGR